MRLESSRELASAIPRPGPETPVPAVDAEQTAVPAPEPAIEQERDWELLAQIQREAEEISAECRATARPCESPAGPEIFDPQSPSDALELVEPEAAAPSAFPSGESDYELLDVDPASIDKYMNRLLARAQQAAPDKTGKSAVKLWPARTLNVELPSFADGRVSETPLAARDSTVPPRPAAERPHVNAIAAEDRAAREPSAARNPGETRANRESLREIVVQSTRSALVQHIRRRHQLVLVRKLLPIFMALTLAAILYAAHFLYGVPFRHLAWAATAIGLIGLLGMVHLWSQAARRQARLNVRVSYARKANRATAGAGRRMARS